VQQKSQPRNARRENSIVACAEIPRPLRLCRKSDSRARQEQAQNGDKIDAAKRAKTTTLSIPYMLAGVGGLELRNVDANFGKSGQICENLAEFWPQRQFAGCGVVPAI
jgi:hypothetical protein